MALSATKPQICALEEQTLGGDSIEVPPADIIACNELRSCADLYRMYRENILAIRPHFQCEVVWRNPAQTRFIDSRVKQLPIPRMCFALDYTRGVGRSDLAWDGKTPQACRFNTLASCGSSP